MNSIIIPNTSSKELNIFYWKNKILILIIIGYSSFYFVRQNFSIALPSFSSEYGYTNQELGWIATCFSIVYGVGKFINGYLSDYSNARYFLSLGLLCSGLINCLFSVVEDVYFFVILWGINGCFQSMGWPPCAKILTNWFEDKEIGTKWSIWASSHQIGSAIITIFGAFLIIKIGWRAVFYVPGIIVTLVALLMFVTIKDNPTEVGFNYQTHLATAEDKVLGVSALSIKSTLNFLFSKKGILYLSLANLFLYLPRVALLTWLPLMLVKYKETSLMITSIQIFLFDILAIFGGIVAGIVSDKFFFKNRHIVAITYLVLLASSITILWLVPALHYVIDALILALIGFSLSGPQILVGIILASNSKKNVGVSTGFAGIMGYIGAAFAGGPTGFVIDSYGWNGFFVFLIISCVLSMLFFSLSVQKNI